MSYYDLPPGNADCELGRKIYMEALEDRRGFRYDQLGIEDIDYLAGNLRGNRTGSDWRPRKGSK